MCIVSNKMKKIDLNTMNKRYEDVIVSLPNNLLERTILYLRSCESLKDHR